MQPEVGEKMESRRKRARPRMYMWEIRTKIILPNTNGEVERDTKVRLYNFVICTRIITTIYTITYAEGLPRVGK